MSKVVVVARLLALDDQHTPQPTAYIVDDVKEGLQKAKEWAIQKVKELYPDIKEEKLKRFEEEIDEYINALLNGADYFEPEINLLFFSPVIARLSE